MAYENLNSTVSNFCRSPVIGTWCSVLTTDIGNPTLVTKNESGGLVDSHYILGGINYSGFLGIEYVGPSDLPYYYDGLDFVALEKVSTTSCILKFMEVNNSFKTLNLREEIILKDFAEYSFDALSMAVEYDSTYIDIDTPAGRNYITVNDTSKLAKGMRLFLGPSTDPDSYNECEVVTISSIIPINNRVYLTSFLRNEYVKYNRVSFYKYIYIISNKGEFGDQEQGSIIKIDPITRYVVNYNTNPVYKKLTLSKWCPYFRSIAMLYSCNVLYSDPYDYYKIRRSQFLGNFEDTKKDFYKVYDIAFRDTSLYKLSNRATFKDNSGVYNTFSWGGYYNYQRDSLVPYVANVGIYSGDFYTIDNYGSTTISFKAADQFGVGLRDVNLSVSLYDGDVLATTDPLSGNIVTDINGVSYLTYRSNVGDYNGITHVRVLTQQGSPYTGSNVVAGIARVTSTSKVPNKQGRLNSVTQFVSENRNVVRQIYNIYTETNIRAFSFFSSQGGNWTPAPYCSRERFDLLSYYGHYLGEDQGLNNFHGTEGGAGLTIAWFDLLRSTYDGTRIDTVGGRSSIANRLTVVSNYISYSRVIGTSEYFLIYQTQNNGVGPFLRLSQQPGVDYTVNISQLFHSRHSHWVDGQYTHYLTTNTRLNQFIFVQDAIPPFWSRKNTTDTRVWLRLRPFAASLDADTLVMQIRQDSHIEDTGFTDISDQLVKESYDAGSGLLGLEVTYFPPEYFNHNAVIYIYLSIRDVVGNLIKISYWFTTIRDYLGPYIENISPDINETQVPIITSISFDIKDEGTGVDINTFEMNVNSLVVVPQVINKVTNNYYRVEYFPENPFLNGKEITVSLHVADFAEFPNWLHYGYKFYTVDSSAVLLTGFNPIRCTHGVSRFSDVSFIALDSGSGVDKEKLRLQVHDIDVTDHPYTSILPIIYRVL